MLRKFSLVIVMTIVSACLWQYFNSHDLPVQMVDKWWTLDAEDNLTTSTPIVQFKIEKDEEAFNDLIYRLKHARFVDSIKSSYFEYGFNGNYLKKVVDYWINNFNWDHQIANLNSFQHFKTKIEGLEIHFMRLNNTNTNGKKIPLMMVHGWPGSIWEFHKIMPLLNKIQNGFSFDVICPSIPGYAYSQAPQISGFAGSDAARIFHKLMKKLGYQQYYVQGGDWGSMIVTNMAKAYPESIKGVHTNFAPPQIDSFISLTKFIIGNFFPSLIYSEKELLRYRPVLPLILYYLRESGYMHIQGTKPDSIGAGLNDSPIGLAAYLLEKFSTWTHTNNIHCADGCLQQKFTLDELLTNVMIYWTTQSITSSMRFYKEVFSSNELKEWRNIPIDVPSGFAAFPQELPGQAKSFLPSSFKNVVLYTDMDRGGHFAALEEPELLAQHIRDFVTIVENLV